MTHLSAIIVIDKAFPWAASLGAFIATESAPLPVEGWAQGGAVGFVTIVLAYAVRHLFDKLEQARGDKIKTLEDQSDEQKKEIKELKEEIKLLTEKVK